MNHLRDLFPLVAEEVSQREKRGDPQHSAAPREPHERKKAQLGGSSDNRGEVAQARDIVAREQSPMADAIEPAVDAIEAFFGKVYIFSVAMHHADAQRAADGIAEADAAPASGHR